MRLLWVAISCCAVSAFPAPAAPITGIPITGSGGSNGNWAVFELSGPGFYATSHGAAGTFGVGWCESGACTLKSTINAIAVPLPGIIDYGWSMGSLNGMEANFLQGSLSLPASVSIPPLPDGLPAQLTASGLFSGDLKGYFEAPDGVDHLLWEVFVSGRVNITLSGLQGLPTEAFYVGEASYEFTGTAVSTPEPASALCLTTALVLIGWLRSRGNRRTSAGVQPNSAPSSRLCARRRRRGRPEPARLTV